MHGLNLTKQYSDMSDEQHALGQNKGHRPQSTRSCAVNTGSNMFGDLNESAAANIC